MLATFIRYAFVIFPNINCDVTMKDQSHFDVSYRGILRVSTHMLRLFIFPMVGLLHLSSIPQITLPPSVLNEGGILTVRASVFRRILQVVNDKLSQHRSPNQFMAPMQKPYAYTVFAPVG